MTRRRRRNREKPPEHAAIEDAVSLIKSATTMRNRAVREGDTEDKVRWHEARVAGRIAHAEQIRNWVANGCPPDTKPVLQEEAPAGRRNRVNVSTTAPGNVSANVFRNVSAESSANQNECFADFAPVAPEPKPEGCWTADLRMAWQDTAISGLVSGIAMGLGAAEFGQNDGTFALMFPGPDHPWHGITYGAMLAGGLSGGALGISILFGHALGIHSMADFTRVSRAAMKSPYPKLLLCAMVGIAAVQGWAAYLRDPLFEKDRLEHIYADDSTQQPTQVSQSGQAIAVVPVGAKQITALGGANAKLQQQEFDHDATVAQRALKEKHRSQNQQAKIVKQSIPGVKFFRVALSFVLSLIIAEFLGAAIPAFVYAVLSLPAGGRHARQRVRDDIHPDELTRPERPKGKRARWTWPKWLAPGTPVDALPSVAREMAEA